MAGITVTLYHFIPLSYLEEIHLSFDPHNWTVSVCKLCRYRSSDSTVSKGILLVFFPKCQKERQLTFSTDILLGGDRCIYILCRAITYLLSFMNALNVAENLYF